MSLLRNSLRYLLSFRFAASTGRNLAHTTECIGLPCGSAFSVTSPGIRSIFTTSLQKNAARTFASSVDTPEQSGSGREMQIRFVRIIAFGMILVAATKIVPLMSQSTVPHAIQLCQASEPIMQKSAAHRVGKLAETDESLQELVAAGVCPKLLGMLKPDVDPGVATAVLSAVKEISRLPEGREALKSAGAPAVLDKSVQQQWLTTQQDIDEASKISRWLMTR
ncbi:hypothetical protein ABBQ38_011606 [Trebouxia sp. C0009 RCD-2024]